MDWEDSLEEGMATHSSILVRRIPMDRGTWWATFNDHLIEFHHWCVCVYVCVFTFSTCHGVCGIIVP